MTVADHKLSVLRQLQQAELEILLDVVAVCEKNNIKYFLSSGTLLGAVRHKGFIPWDDDVDIDIPVNDYYRFVRIAQKELGDKYFVQNSMTEPNFNFCYTKIRMNNTTLLSPYDRSYKIHHGVWIDVFPLVAVQPGLSLKLQRMVIKLSNFVQIQDKIDSHKSEFQHSLGSAGMLVINTFSKLPLKTRQKIHNSLLKMVFSLNPDKCSHRANVWGNITSIIPKDVYEGDAQEIVFENHLFKVPHGYIKYLEEKYGDYMTPPPIEERHGHGYDLIVDLKNSYEKYTENSFRYNIK